MLAVIKSNYCAFCGDIVQLWAARRGGGGGGDIPLAVLEATAFLSDVSGCVVAANAEGGTFTHSWAELDLFVVSAEVAACVRKLWVDRNGGGVSGFPRGPRGLRGAG